MGLSCSSAGAETTYTALNRWVLAVMAYPEVQRRAQAELDSVVRRSRVPAFQMSRAFRIYRQWSRRFSYGDLHSRFRSHVARQRTTGTTECLSRMKRYAFRVFVNATMTLCPMVTTRRGSIQGSSSTLPASLFLDLQRRAVRDTSRSGSGSAYASETMLPTILFSSSFATTLCAMNLERVWDQEGKEIPLDTDSFFDTGIVV